MKSLAELLDEHVLRRKGHRKFFIDNAREMHGLPSESPDDIKIVSVEIPYSEGDKSTSTSETSETSETSTSVSTTESGIPGLKEALSPPVIPQEKSLLKKITPLVLSAALGGGAVGGPLLYSLLTAEDTDTDTHAKKSLLQVIEDEQKHIFP